MVQVPTQTFVVNFLKGFVVYTFWWYITCKTIDTLIRLVEDHSNFVEVQEKDEADDTDAEEDTAAEETN